MIADLRLPIADSSRNEIRNSGAGIGILRLGFSVSIFEFRFSSFDLCESIDNQQSTIGN
jgi:hypothetical protein